MAKVIARIVIDTEDLEQPTSIVDELSLGAWRHVLTTYAHPFTAQEVSYGSGLSGDQYFV